MEQETRSGPGGRAAQTAAVEYMARYTYACVVTLGADGCMAAGGARASADEWPGPVKVWCGLRDVWHVRAVLYILPDVVLNMVGDVVAVICLLLWAHLLAVSHTAVPSLSFSHCS